MLVRHLLCKNCGGGNYYDAESKKWTESSVSATGRPLKRGFCKFIIEPIQRIFDICMNDNRPQLLIVLNALNIPLNEREQCVQGKELVKTVMQKWLPVSEVLLEIVTTHLSPPSEPTSLCSEFV
jgi:elongation factor 2